MNPSIDSLISQQVPIKSLSGGGLELAAKNADVNATVISSKLIIGTLNALEKNSSDTNLPKKIPLSGNAANNSQNRQLFQLTVSNGKQNYLLSSNTPLTTGTQIQIKMTETGLVIVLKENSGKPQNTKKTTISSSVSGDSNTKTATNSIAAQNRSQTSTQRSQIDNTNLHNQESQRNTGRTSLPSNNALPTPAANSRTESSALNSSITHSSINRPEGSTQTVPTKMFIPVGMENSTLKTQQVIDQGIRQTLPQQQGLKLLVPLLQQLTKSTHSQAMPSDVSTKIKQLLTEIPTANHLQKPLNLKSAMQNSGIFLEAKLHDKPTNMHLSKATQNNVAVNKDVKSLIQQLLIKVSENTPGTTTPSPGPASLARQTPNAITSASVTAATPTLTPSIELDELELPAPIDGKPSILTSHSANTSVATPGVDNIDIALRLLSRQLLASIARIQLNQLESLSPRKINSTENQGPVNSWFLEIPIINGRHIDNVEMRIDQEEHNKNEEKEEKDTQTMWTVMLSFDLHALGKMNVQLKVLNKSVSATIWSQLENTHKEAKQHIEFLYKGLEKVGVTVNQIDCKLGTPPKNPATLYRQLVDIRT
ncbi:MAG: hypothetical protein ACI89U_002818 [Gammaproteobacteria bacterium]|jgi:hypothetical protein